MKKLAKRIKTKVKLERADLSDAIEDIESYIKKEEKGERPNKEKGTLFFMPTFSNHPQSVNIKYNIG